MVGELSQATLPMASSPEADETVALTGGFMTAVPVADT